MNIFAAAFLVYFGLQIYTISPFYSGPGSIGFDFDHSSSTLTVLRVDPNSIGERAGLRAGDHIVEVNGVNVGRRVEWDMAEMTFEVGRPMPLVVERDAKRIELTVTLEPWTGSIPWRFQLMVIGNLVTLLLALIVAFRRPYDLVARIGGWFLATAAIFVFPPIPGFITVARHLPVPLQALLCLAIASTGVLPAILLTFFAVFPRVLFHRRWTWALIWTPALLAVASRLLNHLALAYGWQWASSGFGLSTPGLSVLQGCYVLGGLTILVVNYRRLRDVNERRRMRVLVVGTVVGWVAIGTFLGFIVAGGGRVTAALFKTPVPSVLFLLYLAFPSSFAYAILRHRVFDLGLIVRRGLQYALARSVLLTAVPALALLLLGDLLLHGQQPLLEILRARGWIYLSLGGLAVLAYAKRVTWLESLDRRFFRERYDAQRLLREVVEEVREARGFSQVASRVVARVETALHPEFAALLVREAGEQSYRNLAVAPAGHAVPALSAQSKLMAMVRLLGKPLEVPQTGSSWIGEQLPHEETDFLRQARVEFLVPIATAPDRTEALLVLGTKRSEEPYSREDRDLLIAIAASLALLLEKPRAPQAPRGDIFEECPKCGVCYDSGATQCDQEGARLLPVVLPRLLERRYRVERRLGRGGMGTVYLASDTALERHVAVKVIREDFVGSAEAAERFRREARAAASFAHPNVVTVHDFGVASGTRAFLVMELLEGATLRDELQHRKRFHEPEALRILRDVGSALQAAHGRQLVHRDLKPENIFIVRRDSQEIAKVLDFGIAKFLPAASGQATADTAPGALLGTLRYMSPEQRFGGEADPLWDLWALSVVAYEMLTGAYPFDEGDFRRPQGAGTQGTFTPVALHLPDAPEPWQKLFERAFSRDPHRRPQTAEAFLAELQSA